MDESIATSENRDQTDEDILTYTVSDEALEAAAGTERGALRRGNDPTLSGPDTVQQHQCRALTRAMSKSW